jgi:hypothetical protein
MAGDSDEETTTRQKKSSASVNFLHIAGARFVCFDARSCCAAVEGYRCPKRPHAFYALV